VPSTLPDLPLGGAVGAVEADLRQQVAAAEQRALGPALEGVEGEVLAQRVVPRAIAVEAEAEGVADADVRSVHRPVAVVVEPVAEFRVLAGRAGRQAPVLAAVRRIDVGVVPGEGVAVG